MSICEARRKDGKPCTVRALPGDRFCFAHSEATAAKRRQARITGGENSATGARLRKLVPRDLRAVLSVLLQALSETHAGTLTPSQATAMASLAGAIVRCYEVAEIEGRLAALESHDDKAV